MTLNIPLPNNKVYVATLPYDQDVIAQWKQHRHHGDQAQIESAQKLLLTLCRCGHPRHEHHGATGALASIGGSACGECWVCGTFTADDGSAEETTAD